MKTTKILAILVLALGLMVWPATVSEAGPMGTAFTYQGHLYDANYVADGLYDFQFKLYDSNDPCTGNQIGGDVNKPDVDVIAAYFTVELDFGGVFDGNGVWLEIGVRPGEMNDPNEYTFLEPLQEVTPTPYAIYAETAEKGGDQAGNFYIAGNLGIGKTDPSEKLDVEGNIHASGSIKSGNSLTLDGDYYKLITSSGEMYFGRGPTGNFGDVKVGIGTTNPSEKLEVAGNVKVSGTGNGVIFPDGTKQTTAASGGASFPPPAYNSGWVSINPGYTIDLTHNIGGNVDNYVVDLQFKTDNGNINNVGYGCYYDTIGRSFGASWSGLTNTKINVSRRMYGGWTDQVRVRIWVYE